MGFEIIIGGIRMGYTIFLDSGDGDLVVFNSKLYLKINVERERSLKCNTYGAQFFF